MHSRVLDRPRAELPTPLGGGGRQPRRGRVLCLFVCSLSEEDNKVILCSRHPSGEGPRPGLAGMGRGSGAPRSTPMHTWMGRNSPGSHGQGHGAARTTGRGPRNRPQEKSHGCQTTSTWVTQPPTPAGVGTGRDGGQGQDLEAGGGRWWEFCSGFPGTSRLLPCLQTKGRIERQTNKQRRTHLGSAGAIRFVAGCFVAEMFVSVKKCQSFAL